MGGGAAVGVQLLGHGTDGEAGGQVERRQVIQRADSEEAEGAVRVRRVAAADQTFDQRLLTGGDIDQQPFGAGAGLEPVQDQVRQRGFGGIRLEKKSRSGSRS